MSEVAGTAPIVIVTEGGGHIWAIVNAIADRFGPVTVILETPISKWLLLKRRARRQGWISVLGQMGTMVLVRLGKRFGASHVEEIVAEYNLKTEPAPNQHIVQVPSANAPQTVEAIADIRPSVVLLAGCRVLTSETLASIPCPVINYHAGINPKYRGMNGAYWALANNDAQNFGTTVHLVDAGVDTGAVLRHTRGKPEHGDTISSYPLRQAAISRDACIEVIEKVLAGRIEPFDPGLPSRIWFHPTIWSYLWTGIRRGIW
ncbi:MULTISPECIES: formyl transferase [Phyllobacteriaceae]|jgi:methionyl-tRNA formyltransferase|uniref:phosphoribosylglycinamide formyltransferase 1 n=1 Tax=Mesorhizobium hungaricum TaxID=1566387 RepID=A0A1C2DNU2_9HYPH|nr:MULTISPECIES: formyl transferase [Mesorhizobium]MBN9233760.1 formyl transferase [Mesorhizobium sp.]MDQ0328432.1 methionyl-tRNA formyltransferase [Mesorhizobium sp. YL-MeA3-2017]OCX16333.1 formyl transferase [Mesorhizobium hungaricum]